ncbi:MAG: cyclic nucleotide-binding domain-containing protein, partial [Anaerolineales bacterium]
MKFNTRPVLTLDIVDFSEMSTDAQIAAIRLLIQWLHEAIPPEHNNELSRLWSPAGDGGSITFLTDIKPSWKTAIALNQLVKEHNQKHPSTQPIQLRLGLHSGSVVEEKDFDNRVNVWGPGINTSARVASLAKPGQIVASKKYVEEADLARRHEDVVPIGKWWTKHYKSIELYNINIEGAGIRPEEVDIWYGPFHYPLQQAIETYEAMLDELLDARERGFRIAVVAKRLLDIDPRNRAAKLVLEALSKKTVARPSELKGKDLHDDFLSPLSPAALNYFFSNAKFRSFRKDENVVKEGDIADSMMMVVSGKVGLFFKVRGGSSQDLSPGNENQDTGVTLEEGEIIGEMGLFSPGNKRTATVKAL